MLVFLQADCVLFKVNNKRRLSCLFLCVFATKGIKFILNRIKRLWCKYYCGTDCLLVEREACWNRQAASQAKRGDDINDQQGGTGRPLYGRSNKERLYCVWHTHAHSLGGLWSLVIVINYGGLPLAGGNDFGYASKTRKMCTFKDSVFFCCSEPTAAFTYTVLLESNPRADSSAVLINWRYIYYNYYYTTNGNAWDGWASGRLLESGQGLGFKVLYVRFLFPISSAKKEEGVD